MDAHSERSSTRDCAAHCPVIEVSIRSVAKQCVFIIRGCLREEEWIDAEEEFQRVIFDGLKGLLRCEFSRRTNRSTVTEGVAHVNSQTSGFA